MGWFPGAIRKPITASKGRKALTVYNRINLHTAVSQADSLFGYFNKSGIPDSHFYVRTSGVIEQYVNTAYRAFADLEGNDATISIETEGLGNEPWSAAQVKSLAALVKWVNVQHGIPLKLATSARSGSASQGLSWHRLGCDGNFPSLPNVLAGRLQRGGGMHWSTSYGKVCPGDLRVKQVANVLALAKGAVSTVANVVVKKPVITVPKPPTVAPVKVNTTLVKGLQGAARVAKDGKWGAKTDEGLHNIRMASTFKGGHFPNGVAATQRTIGVKADGIWGPKSRAAHDKAVKAVQSVLKKAGLYKGAVDGIWGYGTDKAFVEAWRMNRMGV